MSNPLQFGLHHGAISVPSLEDSLAWYGRVLGFEVESQFDIPAIPARVAMLRNGDLRIEVFEVPGAAPLPESRRTPDVDNRTHGNKHVAFVTPDVTALHEELVRRGADIVWLRHMPHGSAMFIRDNAGNLIEFVQAPLPAGTPAAL